MPATSSLRRQIAHFCAALLPLAAAALLGSPALAAGSPATTIDTVTLYNGPGSQYAMVATLPFGVAIRVDRCQNLWCHVAGHGKTGWMWRDSLTFGAVPAGPFSGPKLHHPIKGDGIICFYTGANFTGRSVCAESGFTVHDLALYGLDNAFESVSVEGEVSANICRDFNFGSYCQNVAESRARLDPLLWRNVSSFQVW